MPLLSYSVLRVSQQRHVRGGRAMSTWINIKKQEDVEYDEGLITEASIDVLIGDDDFGNNYVSIPVEFIL